MKTAPTIAALLLFGASLLVAQQPPDGGPKPARREGPGPFAEALFPPDMVMRNQRLIGLAPKQKQELREEMRKAGAPLTDLQWRKAEAEDDLMEAISPAKPDEAKAAAALDKLLDAENAMKRFQFGLMLRVKAILTPEQQQQLAAIRAQKRALRQVQPERPQAPGIGAPNDEDGQGATPGE